MYTWENIIGKRELEWSFGKNKSQKTNLMEVSNTCIHGTADGMCGNLRHNKIQWFELFKSDDRCSCAKQRWVALPKPIVMKIKIG